MKSLISQITPESIILAQPIGLASNAPVSHAVRSFNAIVLKLSATLELSAVEPAILKEAESCQGVGGDTRATPIVLARKPLSEKTVAANVLRWGTGALNIDATRIQSGDLPSACKGTGWAAQDKKNAEQGYRPASYYAEQDGVEYSPNSLGRWPANLAHDGSEEVLSGFPNDAGRFFYSAKASKADRAGSKHPTVKPVKLMQWLVRMITPPGGTVLDPFAGSGTTGHAALLEGFNAVLIEREAEYRADITRRIELALSGDVEKKSAITKKENTSDLPLFGDKP